MIGKDEIERFIAEGMYADTTQVSYRKTLMRFTSIVKIPSKGWESRAVAFRDAKECGTYGKALYIATARSFLNWCLSEDLIQKNPLKKVRIRLPTKSNRSSLTDKEVKSLLGSMDSEAKRLKRTKRIAVLRDKAAIVFMLHTAMRVGGVISLDIEDFKHSEGVAIASYRNKGGIGKDSSAHVTKKPLDAVKRYLESTGRTWKSTGPLFCSQSGKRTSYHGLTKSIMKRLKASGIREEVSPHWMRHTAATKAYRAGADIKAVQRLLDHKDLNTTDRYVHTLDDAKHSAEGKISY